MPGLFRKNEPKYEKEQSVPRQSDRDGTEKEDPVSVFEEEPYGDPEKEDEAYGDPEEEDGAYEDPEEEDDLYGDPEEEEKPYGDPEEEDEPYGDPEEEDDLYGDPEEEDDLYGDPEEEVELYADLEEYKEDLGDLDDELVAAIRERRQQNHPGSRSRHARRGRRDGGAAAFGSSLGSNEALFAAFIIPVVTMIAIFMQRKIFPFGDRTFLRTDMYHQYAPFFSEFRNKLTEGGSLFYSWDIGMGVNFTALYAYYLASPLNWLLVLCPKDLVIEFMTYMIVLKIGLSGLSFAYYLKKHCEVNDFGIAFFGIFYALSGYMAAYSWNIMWLDCILLFPLIMLGIERLVRRRKGMLYTVTLGLSILSNYYISIMICIFMVMYFVCLLVLDAGKEKKPRDYAVNVLQFGVCSLLAGGLAAAVLLPELYALSASASAKSTFPKSVSSYFSIFDMIARHIGNVETEIGLNHWPNIYCGVAVLMFFLLYLVCRKVSLRQKTVYCGLLLFFLASFSTNVLNFIWHGFHYPNSLPCRQSFIYIFLLLYVCYEAYRNLKEMEWKHIALAFGGSVCFVLLAEKLVEQSHFKWWVYYVAIIFLALYAGLLYLYRQKKTSPGIVLLLALALVSVEASVNTTITSVTTTGRSAYIQDNDDVRRLTENLADGNTFYRVEKVKRKTKNDGAWMNFPSVSLFSSVASADMTAFFKQIGCEGSVNAYSITGSTPFVDSLFSVKYGLYPSEQWQNENLMFIGQSGDTYLYMRDHTLPLGFMLPEEFSTMWDRSQGNPAAVQNQFGRIAGADDMLVSTGGENTGDTFRFTAEWPGDYYVFLTNFQSVDKVKMLKNEETTTFDNVDRGYLLEVGWCDAGDQVTITNDEPGEAINGIAYRFDFNALGQVCDQLNRYPFQVTGWSDDRVDGAVTAHKDGILFTSIPYDGGWSVWIDGKKQQTEKIFDAFLGIPVTAGTHTVTLKYFPQGLAYGLGISGICAAILLVTAAVWRVRHPKAKKRKKEPRPAET